MRSLRRCKLKQVFSLAFKLVSSCFCFLFCASLGLTEPFVFSSLCAFRSQSSITPTTLFCICTGSVVWVLFCSWRKLVSRKAKILKLFVRTPNHVGFYWRDLKYFRNWMIHEGTRKKKPQKCLHFWWFTLYDSCNFREISGQDVACMKRSRFENIAKHSASDDEATEDTYF